MPQCGRQEGSQGKPDIEMEAARNRGRGRLVEGRLLGRKTAEEEDWGPLLSKVLHGALKSQGFFLYLREAWHGIGHRKDSVRIVFNRSLFLLSLPRHVSM